MNFEQSMYLQRMTAGRMRRLMALAIVLVPLTTIGIAVPAIRHSILRAAGRMLVVDERVGPADAIVVSGETHEAGPLEAADLVHSGVASRVAIFTYAPDDVEREYTRRGVPFEDPTARLFRELRALGLVSVEQIPTYVTGTEDEGPVLARWCDEQRLHSVVVVATPDHSRRLRRVLHRSMKGHRVAVMVRSAHYTGFDPDQWWNSRDGIRTEIEELEKLLLDIVRHPLS